MVLNKVARISEPFCSCKCNYQIRRDLRLNVVVQGVIRICGSLHFCLLIFQVCRIAWLIAAEEVTRNCGSLYLCQVTRNCGIDTTNTSPSQMLSYFLITVSDDTDRIDTTNTTPLLLLFNVDVVGRWPAGSPPSNIDEGEVEGRAL